MKTINKSILAFCIVGALYACKAKKETVAQPPVPPTPPVVEVKPKSVCDSMVVTYTKHIKPLVELHCVRCHGNFRSYEQVRDEAGRPAFIGSIKHEEPFHPMPKNMPKLDDNTIKVFSCWVETGRQL